MSGKYNNSKTNDKFKNTVGVVLMLAVFTFLTVFFYIIPETRKLQATGGRAKLLSINEGEGIGGGDIIGNSKAGKKDLPIYCVDIPGKLRQQNQMGNDGIAGNADNTDNVMDNSNAGNADNARGNSNAGNTDNARNNSNADNAKNNNTGDINNVKDNSNTGDNSGNNNGSDEAVKYVSLSFDAAWGADDTIRILDILDKYNVKVTFFMTGGWVDEYPDMVKEIYSRGHDLGNHSQNHKKMSELNVEQQKQELQSVTDKVKELTGYDMFLFRPPYGDYNSTLINTAYSINYYPIQWSVDSLDWKDYGVDNIIKTVTRHKALSNGAIILMHNGAKYTADALDTVISSLQQQGYTLVPISQLIIRNNFHMDANGMQVAD